MSSSGIKFRSSPSRVRRQFRPRLRETHKGREQRETELTEKIPSLVEFPDTTNYVYVAGHQSKADQRLYVTGDGEPLNLIEIPWMAGEPNQLDNEKELIIVGNPRLYGNIADHYELPGMCQTSPRPGRRPVPFVAEDEAEEVAVVPPGDCSFNFFLSMTRFCH